MIRHHGVPRGPRIHFEKDVVHTELSQRGAPNSVARAFVDRYLEIIKVGRHRLRGAKQRGRLTADELGLLCEISEETEFGPEVFLGFADRVLDVPDNVYEKWNVDHQHLRDFVSRLDVAEAAALVDAIERFWTAASHGVAVDHIDLLEDKPVMQPRVD